MTLDVILHPLFVLTLCFPILSAELAYLVPTTVIVYQDQDKEISLCVQNGTDEICGLKRWHTYPKAYCNMYLLTGVDSKGANQWTFQGRIVTAQLIPGYYTFLCYMNENAYPSRMNRLILPNSQRLLDCSAWPATVNRAELFGAIHVCCLRPILPTDWLQQTLDPLDVCVDPDCTSNDESVIVSHGWLRLHPTKAAKTNPIQVQCNNEEFTENVYVYDSRSATLQLKYYPAHPVILSHQTPIIGACLGWSNNPNCSRDLSSSSTIDCVLTEFGQHGVIPSNTDAKHPEVVTFKNSLSATTIKEGTYKMVCSAMHLNLNVRTVVHILHGGHYNWSCADAPNVIYLADVDQQLVFCTWTFFGSKYWSSKLQQFGLSNKPFRCVIEPLGLVFHNGTLRLNGDNATIQTGIYEVKCDKHIVKRNWVVANTPEDLHISILPLSGLINRSIEGNLVAYLGWRNKSTELQQVLNRQFSIMCNVENRMTADTIYFTFNRTVRFQALRNGLVRIRCHSPELNLRSAPISKVVVGRPKNPILRPVMSILPQSATLTEPMPSSPESDSCYRPGVVVYWETDTILVEVLEWYSKPATQDICPDERPGEQYMFHVMELHLEVKPEQRFYTFDQNPPILIKLTKTGATEYEQSLLARIEAKWNVLNPKGKSRPLLKHKVTRSVTNFASFDVPDSLLIPGEYVYEYILKSGHLTLNAHLILLHARSMRLVIHGLNKKFHFAGESHAYTCVLEGVILPQTALERYKPRWKSMLPGSQVTEVQNVIRIMSDSTMGLHNYRCYYKQNGLDLFEDIIFLIAEKSKVRLDLKFFGNVSLIYDPQKDTPFVRCQSSHVYSMLNRPVWRSLVEGVQYSAYDHSDYTSGISDLFVTERRSGLSTFQCMVRLQDLCLTRIFIFYRKIQDLQATFIPNRRTFVYNTTVRCAEDKTGELNYLRKMQMISKRYGQLESLTEVTRWIGSKMYEDSQVAFIRCVVRAYYMENLLAISKTKGVVEIHVPMHVTLKPMKKYYRAGETVKCVAETSFATRIRRAALFFYDSPESIQTLTHEYTFPSDFEGNRHKWECIFFPPNNEPHLSGGWFDFFVPSTGLNITPVYVDSRLLGWQCLASGFPKEPATYILGIPDIYEDLFQITDNRVLVTSYSPPGILDIYCQVNLTEPEFQSIEGYECFLLQENLLALSEYVDDFTLNVRTVLTIISVLSTTAVMLLYTYVIFYMTKKHQENGKYVGAFSTEPPKRLIYVVMQESSIGRLDHYFLSTVVKLFSEIQQMCVKLQDKHESEESSSITMSVHRDSTQSVTSMSSRGFTRSSMISSVHDPDLMSSLESLSLDFMQRSRGLHDGMRRSIMILGEPGMSKVPLILSGAEATRRVSLTLDPNILNLIRPRTELSEHQESEASENTEKEQQIKLPVRRREKKPQVLKTNRTRRKRNKSKQIRVRGRKVRRREM